MMKEQITEEILDFIADDVTFGDNFAIAIDRNDGTAELIDIDAPGYDPDDDPRDVYPAMDLVRMSATEPGTWEPDPEAITEIINIK